MAEEYGGAMRLVVTRVALRRILQLTGGALFCCAATLLAYSAFVLVDSWTFQREQRVRLEHALHQVALAETARVSPPAANGDVIGSIDIPRLGLSVIVVEGTSAASLRRAAGHIAGTASPGQAGNVGIAGHRDTFFRPLRDIQQNDVITLTTLQGRFHYRVVSTSINDPSDVAVLDPGASDTLTLVTCYPFYFAGPAPDRFIVRAERLI